MITIIDYGMGNIGSIANMLRRIGHPTTVATDSNAIKTAEKIILPGVGSFDAGMRNLHERDMVGILNEKVLSDGVPILGICLGMQLFSKSSEEGVRAGLGWLDAVTVRLSPKVGGVPLKIPHMGWNAINICHSTPLFPNEDSEQRFYFVHSYHVKCSQPEDVLANTTYGTPFTSSVLRGNIFATQFHPEKSHLFGLGLLERFVKWKPSAGS